MGENAFSKKSRNCFLFKNTLCVIYHCALEGGKALRKRDQVNSVVPQNDLLTCFCNKQNDEWRGGNNVFVKLHPKEKRNCAKYSSFCKRQNHFLSFV